MQDNGNICHECGQYNEPQYKYCKNCGAVLDNENGFNADSKNLEANGFYGNNDSEYNQYNQSYGTDSSGAYLDSIDGIPTEEIAAFTGSKAPSFISKFSKMQLENSKLSWCWPVFILGFLFGPLGSAIWFFYRKMYKAAVILVLIGFITTAVFTAVGTVTDKEASLDTNEVISELEKGNIPSVKEIDFLGVAQFENAVNIATAVITSLFAFYLYKKHSVNKILEYRRRNTDPRYYRIGLSVVGGTSGGMAVLGVVLLFVANMVSGYILSLTGFNKFI